MLTQGYFAGRTTEGSGLHGTLSQSRHKAIASLNSVTSVKAGLFDFRDF